MSISIYSKTYGIKCWYDNNLTIKVVEDEGITGTAQNNTMAKVLRFQLMDDDGVINIPTSNASAYLCVERTNGTTKAIRCTVDDYFNGIVVCSVTDDLTDLSGYIRGEIRLLTPNAVLKFCGVNFNVLRTTSPEEDLPDPDEDITVDTDKQVIFWDYNGTPLYSYTANEINTISQLPPPPTHEGLNTIGWNWTLAEIRDSVQRGDTVDVGCYFSTVDGKTHLYISLTEDMVEEIDGSNGIEVKFGVRQSEPNQVNIDWGDGSEPSTTETVIQTVLNETNYEASHIYSIDANTVYPLNIVIKISANSTFGFGLPYRSGTSSGIYYSGSKNISSGIVKIELSENCESKTYAFSELHALKYITAPYGFGSRESFYRCYSLICVCSDRQYESDCFGQCHAIKSICSEKRNTVVDMLSSYAQHTCLLNRINNVSYFKSIGSQSLAQNNLSMLCLPQCEDIGGSAFEHNHHIKVVSIPQIRSIGYQAFNDCENLLSITLPSCLQSVGYRAFYGCYKCANITINGSCEISDGAFKTLGSNYSQFSFLEWVDLTAYHTADSIPTLTSSFGSTFTTRQSSNRKVAFYVYDETMKQVFANATNWSDGADYFVVGTPPTD